MDDSKEHSLISIIFIVMIIINFKYLLPERFKNGP